MDTVSTNTTNNTVTTPSSEDVSDMAFDNLYPAIIRCFVIVLLGYMAGRFNILTGLQAKGVGNYVTYFALPVLLFKSMVELNFRVVNWVFLCCILISKTVIFVGVFLFSLLLGRPLNYGKAGLFGIFTTQSNDFALGYPIVNALYSKTNPSFVQYIYLVAPISLAFLNPIGFIFLEIEKRKTSNGVNSRQPVYKMALHIVKGVVTNPIVFMTVFGLIGNLIFQHNMPAVLDGFLTAVASSFDATALFYLGISMVGKFQSLSGYTLITPVLLVAVKLLFLPLLTREIITGLDPGSSDNVTSTLEYTMFGFLYSTFPTAPTVFLYASQYDTAKDIIASGLVIGTFTSAPFMFLSAKMVTLPTMKIHQYKSLITETSRDISILGMICSIWVVMVLILNRRWRAMPHHLTLCLVISQFIGCLGMVLTTQTQPESKWVKYLEFTIFFIGTTSSRVWTGLLALGLAFMRCRSLCFVLRAMPWFVIIGFGVPSVLCGILLLSSYRCDDNENDPSFQYGTTQLIISTVVLTISLLVTVAALVYQQRNHRSTAYKPLDASGDHNDSSEHLNKSDSQQSDEDKAEYGACGDNADCNDCEVGCKDVEDIIPYETKKMKLTSRERTESTDSSYLDEGTLNERTCLVGKCSPEKKRNCLSRLRTYQKNNSSLIQLDKDDDVEFQYTRHITLLLILIISMCIGIFLCMYRLFNESTSGVYIEMEFLDSVFNFGQAFFVFALFGLDTQLIIVPCVKRWRKLIYGKETIHLPPYEDLDEDVKRTCQKFMRYHKSKCMKAIIVSNKRYRFRTYNNVFSGKDLVDWLLEVGLASDQIDAISYGEKLLIGRVIKHVAEEYHFYNASYFYNFVIEDSDSQIINTSIQQDEVESSIE